MFDLISRSMLFLLENLKLVVGNYGWAIVVLTILVRVALWPLSASQTKSMQMMQILQPKMKQLQDRYKADPQKLQAEMMKLYKEYKFNPLGGCLPMLVQFPIFIGLYWALYNPHFMAFGDPTFLRFIHLKHTSVVSHAGLSFDGKMNIAEKQGGFMGFGRDRIVADAQMKVILTDGKTLSLKVPDPNKILTVLPKSPQPDIPLTILVSFEKLGLDGYQNMTKAIDMTVVNAATKEAEKIEFVPQKGNNMLQTTLPTVGGKDVPHFDVLFLVILFALTSVWSQKLMSAQTPSTGNQQQQQLMKLMPLMFSFVLLIFPIPSGALLYMDTNSLFQIFQTWYLQKKNPLNIDKSDLPSQKIVDIKPEPEG